MSSSVRILKNLVEKYTRWRLKSSPEYATGVDVHDYNDSLEAQSIDAYTERYNSCCGFMKELQDTVEVDDLPENDLFVHRLLKDDLEVFSNGYKWRFHSTYNAVNFLETIPIDFMSFLIDTTRFEHLSDFEKYVQRLDCIPKQISQQIELMEEAIKKGTTLHRCSMDRTVTHFEKQLMNVIEKSIFYEPVDKKLPLLKDLSEGDETRITDLVTNCIEKEVYPSLETISDFVSKKYLPSCRPEYGVACLPDGEEFYAACLRWHTTSSLTPKQVHDLGQQEVDRIAANMEEVMKEVDFSGTIPEFMAHLRQKSEFYHTDPSEMLQEFSDIILDHISPKLADSFADIPDVKCEIKEMPFDGPGGMYYPASADGTRPGTFFVQLQHLQDFPRFTMMSLALHEAIPGHHFQHISAHAHNLPKFHCERDYRKLLSAPFQFPINTGYVEGWALYAEYLGEEMGAYRTPYEMFGRYSDEMFRATRLVVDTGIHVFGWSRQQAIEYMSQHCVIPEGEIQEEVDRYMTWPGQACAYKVGELKIKELRKLAEKTLGEKFSLKEFHKVVLSLGPVSLGLLEEKVKEWIDKKDK